MYSLRSSEEEEERWHGGNLRLEYCHIGEKCLRAGWRRGPGFPHLLLSRGFHAMHGLSKGTFSGTPEHHCGSPCLARGHFCLADIPVDSKKLAQGRSKTVQGSEK